MPGHVSAADAPEDLWRCHACGWTYPNHHPSAKHRRNHKKQCGKLPGFVTKSGHHGATGSSDECSSDEEHHREQQHLSSNQAHEKDSGNNGHVQELVQSPSPAAATNVEEVSCNGSSNGSVPMLSDDGGARDAPTIPEEPALSTRNLDLPASKEVTETSNDVDQGHTRGSAHPLRGQWCCKHCGWAYSNPHPSAKNRRKHKKNCGRAAAHVGAGGSSDEASSDDGSEPNERAETQHPVKCESGVSQGVQCTETTDGVNAKGKDLSHDGEGEALADTVNEVPLESNSSNPQVPHGPASMDAISGGHVQEKVDVEGAKVAIVDERSRPTFEQALCAPNSTDLPVPLVDDVINSSLSQVSGEIRNGTTSNEQKSGQFEAIIPDQQPLHVTSEQVQGKKPHLPQFSQPILTQENVGEKRDPVPTISQSPVTLGVNSGRHSIEAPQLDMRNPQPKSATRAGVREDLTVKKLEEQSTPETRSPEGLVRSRVQVFEKLAQTSPQYLWKGVSPTNNSASPRQPRRNVITDTKPSKLDAPNELQELFSHLRHRGNFVQNELYMERA